MNEKIKKRVLKEANYILETKETIRQIAKKFNCSKSVVHLDLSKRLKELDESKYEEVRAILKSHDAEKHIRGGEATKQKYKKRR